MNKNLFQQGLQCVGGSKAGLRNTILNIKNYGLIKQFCPALFCKLFVHLIFIFSLKLLNSASLHLTKFWSVRWLPMYRDKLVVLANTKHSRTQIKTAVSRE